jgi:tetratricopeptide (TPR) repeat protein
VREVRVDVGRHLPDHLLNTGYGACYLYTDVANPTSNRIYERIGCRKVERSRSIAFEATDSLVRSGGLREFRDRHLAFFLQLALDAEPGLTGSEMGTWLLRIDAEVENLRAGLDWAFEARPKAALQLYAAMVSYRHVRIASEGMDRFARAMDLARSWLAEPSDLPEASRSALVARVLSRAALLQASYTGRGASNDLEEEATAIARASGDHSAIADTLVWLTYSRVAIDGSISQSGPEGEVALDALRLAEEDGDWYHAAIILSGFAMHEMATDPHRAQQRLDLADAAGERSGNPFALANVAHVHGRAESVAGRFSEARRWFEIAAELVASIGDRRFALVVESELAHALRRDGAIDEAEVAYRRTIQAWQRWGNRGAVAHQLECLSFVASAKGNGERAARLLGAADGLREAAGSQMTVPERQEYDVQVLRLRGALGADALESAWEEGRKDVGGGCRRVRARRLTSARARCSSHSRC